MVKWLYGSIFISDRSKYGFAKQRTNGSKIVWKSSNTDYILDDGTFIKRPDRCSDDIEINLSAEISNNTELFSTCFSYIIEKDSSLSTDVYISAKKG